MNPDEKKIYILECLMSLYSSMGAVTEDTKLKYWPCSQGAKKKSQNIFRKPVLVRVGCMSESRGLHWNRKRES